MYIILAMHRVVQDVFSRGVKTNQVITEVLKLILYHVPYTCILILLNYKNEDIELSRKEFVYFSGRVIRILLFNSTGDREANVLIEPLVVSYEQACRLE